MAKEIHVEGFEAYMKAVQEHKGKMIFAMFCGSKDETGESWCPDCVAAEPVLARNVKHVPADAVLIHCDAGDRTFMKDQNNKFKKEPSLMLKTVPTLLKVGSPRKLEDEQCANDDLVQMFFEED